MRRSSEVDMQFGVNGWVWTSPVDTQAFGEAGAEGREDGVRPVRVRRQARPTWTTRGSGLGQRARGQRVRAAMGPDRDRSTRTAPSGGTRMDYVRRCIERRQRSARKNVVRPLYSAVGRTWQQTADERKRDTDLLVDQLKKLSARASDKESSCASSRSASSRPASEPVAAGGRGRHRSRGRPACGISSTRST